MYRALHAGKAANRGRERALFRQQAKSTKFYSDSSSIERLLGPHTLIHIINMIPLIDLIPQLRDPDLDLLRRPRRRGAKLR